jgi:hypothetical protein
MIVVGKCIFCLDNLSMSVAFTLSARAKYHSFSSLYAFVDLVS